MDKKPLYQWAKAQKLLRSEKAVLRQLVHFCNPGTMETWGTVPALAEEVTYSERKVQYALRNLEQLGLIASTGRNHRTPARRLVPIYRLTPGELPPSNSGDRIAPKGMSDLHRQGRSHVHPHMKEPEKIFKGRIEARKGTVPAWLRADFVAAQDEAWVRSCIDPCLWNADEATLQPERDIAGDKILRDAKYVLRKHGIQLLGKDGHARA